jgi:hypothetical protein
MTTEGKLLRGRWNPLRRELERLLADGAWHEVDAMYPLVQRFVDPRMAIRHWARQYEQNRKRRDDERPPATRVLPSCEQHALDLGSRSVYHNQLRAMRDRGRVELQEWGGRRRVRLVPKSG